MEDKEIKKPENVKEEVKEDIIEEISKETEAVHEEIVKEVRISREEEDTKKKLEAWVPKTSLGKRVYSGEIDSINYIFDHGLRMMEEEIVDKLIPSLGTELMLVGQSKGKYGGGSRRIFKQTQKKTKEGNKPKFTTLALVGNNDGILGLGKGKAKETLPARLKSVGYAKRALFRITRGCGSWECGCTDPHSIPVKVTGRSGSVTVELIPAPKGVGLCICDELKKVMIIAGIKDIWSKTYGRTRSHLNLVSACINALKKLSSIKINETYKKHAGVVEGASK